MKNEFLRTVARMALFVVLASPCLALTLSRHQEPQTENKDAEKKQDKPEIKKVFTKLHVKITAGNNSAPIQAAKVNVKSEEEGVSYDKVFWTDHEGKVDVDVPRGRVRVQVTAQHWDNGGTQRTLREQEETVEIKLARK